MKAEIGGSWSRLVLDLDEKWQIKAVGETRSAANPDATYDFRRCVEGGVAGNIMIGCLGKDDTYDPASTQSMAEEYVRHQGAVLLWNRLASLGGYVANDVKYQLRTGRVSRKVSLVKEDLEYVFTFDLGSNQNETASKVEQSEMMLQGVSWKGLELPADSVSVATRQRAPVGGNQHMAEKKGPNPLLGILGIAVGAGIGYWWKGTFRLSGSEES